jgi:primosomal protein N' (replication factor Y)
MKIARIAIDVPVGTLFDYCSDALDERDIGRLAVVPFGRNRNVGVIVQITQTSELPASRLKPIISILRDVPALAAQDLELLKFAAEYYCYPLGMAVTNALPALLRKAKTRHSACFRLTAAGAAVTPEALPGRALAQRALLTSLRENRVLEPAVVAGMAPSARRILRSFVARGWVEPTEPPHAAQAVPRHVRGIAPVLNDQQTAASHAILQKLREFAPFLLFGVTGSGKTEVYLRIVDAVLEQGRQALILLPEIALTPQFQALISARFPATPIATLHSGLNENERLSQWRDAYSGAARIILGTRLAVFAPAPELGVIIVDEEHDASFKQQEGFRYSARDLAVLRARRTDIPLVLGSATPSLETYHNALAGRYTLLALRRRINHSLPRIECIDTRNETLTEGLSTELMEAIGSCVNSKQQSLVFINRRGYAPVMLCRACGWLSRCSRCSANLVYHDSARQLRCHHCGLQKVLPTACPTCGNLDLRPVGHGTQRVENALRAGFPGARVLRIDRDSARRKHAWQGMRRQIAQREVDILVGTQMVAKGHDFPHLTVVGVLNADSLLHSTDVRSSERLYALLTQVAGRAGRGEIAGQVFIQTDFPDHPLYRALKEQDYEAFARTVLDERKQAGFPPYVHQALLRAEAANMAHALEFLEDAARTARALTPQVTIYDAVPAAMPRVAGRERAQLLVQSASRGHLHGFLKAWQAQLSTFTSTRARWSLDIDPLDF